MMVTSSASCLFIFILAFANELSAWSLIHFEACAMLNQFPLQRGPLRSADWHSQGSKESISSICGAALSLAAPPV